ncbi:DUF3095 family protein [Rhizobium aegyptiacum]|uniref:DUF3095 family protein n=1 Tax=Rhizobium aegyptiacum TaxID=1764550 RepID=UPI0007E590E0|nr:DUF3095 family protein [Rhizobium aegyptiacum]
MLTSLMQQDHVYQKFASVLDQSAYEPLAEGWLVGMTDIVDSTSAIVRGRYRDVNFAGVSIIAALGNALGHFDFPFTFGGDGAAFAVSAAVERKALTALHQVKAHARRELGLQMRIGLVPISHIRSNGWDVRIALYAASQQATYTMFSGGGIRWTEQQLKLGRLEFDEEAEAVTGDADLTGLSCDWTPFENRKGTILSLLVEPLAGEGRTFTHLARRIVEIFDSERRHSVPLPEVAPAKPGRPKNVDAATWRSVVMNSDFRKYDDVLRLTVDCSLDQVSKVSDMLKAAARNGEVAYGLHCQSHAIMTCFVPSSNPDAHRHFLDGMDGGYAMAAAMMRAAA